MFIYILDFINTKNNDTYSYIIAADSVKDALISFNGHDGADIETQEIRLYSTIATSNNISYLKKNKLVAKVNGSISNNNNVRLLAAI